MRTVYLLTAAAAVGVVAVPAAAQSSYPYPYAQPVPQPYPGQPGYGYQQPGYGYAQQGYVQPYGASPVEQIINQLLGNNRSYNTTDRSAVSRCATAALAQAERQYGNRYGRYGQPYGQPYGQAYGQAYGYNQPYASNRYANPYAQMRVTAISNVERRSNRGLRVRGLIDSGVSGSAYNYGGNRYPGQAYGYPGQPNIDPRYAQDADLSFRCNVDYRGAVSSVRVSRNDPRYGG